MPGRERLSGRHGDQIGSDDNHPDIPIAQNQGSGSQVALDSLDRVAKKTQTRFSGAKRWIDNPSRRSGIKCLRHFILQKLIL